MVDAGLGESRESTSTPRLLAGASDFVELVMRYLPIKTLVERSTGTSGVHRGHLCIGIDIALNAALPALRA
jgi:hypothetical protein